MTHTLLSVLLIALLYVRYSSAVRSSESEQYPYPSSPVPLFGQSTPSPVPVSEHPRDPNPPRALARWKWQEMRPARSIFGRGFPGLCTPNALEFLEFDEKLLSRLWLFVYAKKKAAEKEGKFTKSRFRRKPYIRQDNAVWR